MNDLHYKLYSYVSLIAYIAYHVIEKFCVDVTVTARGFDFNIESL